MALKSRVVLASVVVLFIASFAAAQSNPLVGTWVLNTAKSKYSPGPAPKSATTTIAAEGAAFKFSVHQEPATGPAQDWSFTTNLDGKPSKITGNNPQADTTAYKRVNATTFDAIQSKGGKETQSQRIVLSADGKTRTVTTTGTDSAGKKINNVAVYDKK